MFSLSKELMDLQAAVDAVIKVEGTLKDEKAFSNKIKEVVNCEDAGKEWILDLPMPLVKKDSS